MVLNKNKMAENKSLIYIIEYIILHSSSRISAQSLISNFGKEIRRAFFEEEFN